VSLGSVAKKLREIGVETVGIVGTPADRARLYFRYRPPGYLVGADPELASHRALGVPRMNMNDDVMRVILDKSDGLARESGLRVPPGHGKDALDHLDGIILHDYLAERQQHQVQFTAQFLIDRAGIIRWSNVECSSNSLDEGFERFPTDDELLTAARATAA
jgi:hypothetical protein